KPAYELIWWLEFRRVLFRSIRRLADRHRTASDFILLVVNRRGPADEREWAEIRRSAMTIAESANLLIMRNRNADWVGDARALTEIGRASCRGRGWECRRRGK